MCECIHAHVCPFEMSCLLPNGIFNLGSVCLFTCISMYMYVSLYTIMRIILPPVVYLYICTISCIHTYVLYRSGLGPSSGTSPWVPC